VLFAVDVRPPVAPFPSSGPAISSTGADKASSSAVSSFLSNVVSIILAKTPTQKTAKIAWAFLKSSASGRIYHNTVPNVNQ